MGQIWKYGFSQYLRDRVSKFVQTCNKLPYSKAKLHFRIALNTEDVRGTSGNCVTVAPKMWDLLVELKRIIEHHRNLPEPNVG